MGIAMELHEKSEMEASLINYEDIVKSFREDSVYTLNLTVRYY